MGAGNGEEAGSVEDGSVCPTQLQNLQCDHPPPPDRSINLSTLSIQLMICDIMDWGWGKGEESKTMLQFMGLKITAAKS